MLNTVKIRAEFGLFFPGLGGTTKKHLGKYLFGLNGIFMGMVHLLLKLYSYLEIFI